MHRLRRVTALLVSLLLVQLTLVGTGGFESRCAAHEAEAAMQGASAGASHAAVADDGMPPADNAAATSGDEEQCSECHSAADHVPCSVPSAPGSCAQMTSCAAAIVLDLGPAPESVATWSSAQVVVAPDALLPGPAPAPEPPPPRA